jgi:transcriptional regulator with XRE-family HTH domain
MDKGYSLPPPVRAILQVGPAEVARQLNVKIRTVDQWLKRTRVPVGYIRRMSTITGIPVDEFLAYEEQRIQTRGATGDGDEGSGQGQEGPADV